MAAGDAELQVRPTDDVSTKEDRLMVNSVEKAFRVMEVFDGTRKSLSLSQIATATGLNMSAAQRFTHTLTKLGYLSKDGETRRFRLTVKVLDFGFHYTRSNLLVERAIPYLMHLSKTVEETVNLTVLDGTEIVFISRFMSRHVLNNDVIIGTRLPAFCTAPGIALLSKLPEPEALAILERSNLRPYTPMTTWDKDALVDKIRKTAERGYAVSIEEYYLGDLSFASAIVDQANVPIAAINLAVSTSRFTPQEAEERFSRLVVAAAASISKDFTAQA